MFLARDSIRVWFLHYMPDCGKTTTYMFKKFQQDLDLTLWDNVYTYLYSTVALKTIYVALWDGLQRQNNTLPEDELRRPS